MKRWKVCSCPPGAAPLGFATLLVAVVLVGYLASLPSAARAQVRGPRPGSNEESGLDGVFLPPDRQAKRRLELSGELIGEQRYGEAVRLLGSLLESPEDFFFKPDAESPVYQSLKAASGRLLAGLPAAGRESYELQFGARARQALKEAAAGGKVDQISEVSRRFFYTQAGAEATYLLGRHYLDQNRPLAAVMCFERLREVPQAAARLEPALSLSLASCWLRAGKPDAARDTLAAFRRQYDSGRITVRGEEIRLFTDDAQSLAWLEQHFGKQPMLAPTDKDQWVVFRGDESRNATSSGGQPLLSLRWRQRTSDDAAIEEFVGKLRHDYNSQDMAALPSMHPLAVSDVVLMRTAFAMQAVDFATGKLVWRYSAGEESLDQFLRAMGSQQSGAATAQLLSALDRRVWSDLAYGTMSSDGAQVYYLEDLALTGLGSQVLTVLPNGQRRNNSGNRDTNRLAARDLRTQGKLKWSVGGTSGEDEPKLAGAFFLGPPLPLMGYLYVLAEVKGQEIRLVALSPETGKLEWSQQLAVVDSPISIDEFRRTSGATPSFADGVLVCPTAARAIVGIDLSTRSLLWGYQYPRINYMADRRFNARASIYAGSDQRSAEHWADGALSIADGRVLATPTESEQMYCLNLADGKELWKLDRGNHLYVACMRDGKAYVVGRNAITVLKLADGKRAGTIPLPEGAVPSGRGFYSGEHYYLPLSTAAVAKVNLASLKIEDVAESRSGSIPGNLICYRDSIISQGADYVDAYYQLDALKQRIEDTLATRPEDPQALAALGEIKLDQKDLPEAVDLFRRSYGIEKDPSTRTQLIEALLAGLKSDFATYRGSLDELDQLIEQPRHRVDFLRHKALGLQRAGEVLAAFETYLDLVDQEPPWQVDDVDDLLSVRRDRWIREQLVQLQSAADPEDARKMSAAVGNRLEDALAADSAEVLRGFVSVFGSLPQALPARAALAAKLPPEELLQQNLLLEDDLASVDNAVAGPATAKMAQLLAAVGQQELAAVYYRQLSKRFADVPCAEGQTGRQIVEALPADDRLRALIAEPSWPEGHVSVREQKASPRGPRVARASRNLNLEIHGGRGPLFDGVRLSVQLDMPQQHLVAEDALGRTRFRVLLTEDGMRRVMAARPAYPVNSICYAGVQGGLVVLSMGTQIMAIDTLRAGDSLSNRVLWTQDLNDQVGGLATMQSVMPRSVQLRWGGTRAMTEDAYGRHYGRIGPIASDGVYFQRLHGLSCVDPLSGKTIWTRRNVPLGLDLFGDHEYLIAAPLREGESLILRASTGEQVGTRKLAPAEQRMTTVGRRVLIWDLSEGKPRIKMYDPVSDEVAWSYSLAAGSKADVVEQDVVGVYQPDGTFSLIRLSDGERLIEQKLAPARTLVGIHLLAGEAGYILATNASTPANSNRSIQPFPQIPECPLVTGQLQAFDRTGKPLWASPLAVEQHGLLLTQPSELPVLVFLRQMNRPGPLSSRDPKLSVMCVDKRTGNLVYNKDDLDGTVLSSCSLTADPAARTVTISVPTQTITLSYTGQSEEPQAARPRPDDARLAAALILESLGLRADAATARSLISK